jgi:hypothetical protein
LARRSRQSILKRQREVKKAEKAAAKRQKRAERRLRPGTESDETGSGDLGDDDTAGVFHASGDGEDHPVDPDV